MPGFSGRGVESGRVRAGQGWGGGGNLDAWVLQWVMPLPLYFYFCQNHLASVSLPAPHLPLA